MRKIIIFLAGLLLCSSLHAQVPMTGAGLAKPATGGGSFAVAKKGTSANTSNASTTLSAWSVAYSAGCNTVLVGVAWNTSASATITALTLDGSQAMTAVPSSFFNNLSNNDAAQFFYIVNPTGTTGTPSVTFSGAFTIGAIGLQAWCIATATTTPSAGNGNGTGFASSISASVTVPSGGAVFGICTGNGSVGAWNFTNITLDNNIVVPNEFGPADMGSGHATGGAGASVSVTCADVAVDNGPWVLSVAAMAP